MYLKMHIVSYSCNGQAILFERRGAECLTETNVFVIISTII